VSSSTDAVPGRERLVDQAYRQIRDAIVAVRLQPGSPLDEKALSASLGLGLTPIRDALKRLTLEKLAITYPHRGTFVSRINIADEARLTEIRVELEGLAAALAAERATAEDQAVLLALLGDLERGSHERAENTELDARVHRAIYTAARNEYLEATLNQYANLALRIWNFCLHEQLAADGHIRSQRAVVEAIVRRDPAAARSAAEQHLRGFAQEVRSTVLASRA
jgi:DNA-binding GntR family transcriptional regulator